MILFQVNNGFVQLYPTMTQTTLKTTKKIVAELFIFNMKVQRKSFRVLIRIAYSFQPLVSQICDLILSSVVV